MDQLQKQNLDNNEFQEIVHGFFKVLETQFQIIPLAAVQFHWNMSKSIDERALHKMEYDSRVNERQTQTTVEKVDTGKELDASLVIIESNGTESQEADTKRRSEELSTLPLAIEKTTSPRSCLRWQPTGRILKTVCLRWVPTGKIFTSSTTKVDSEPPNGSKEDITNQCESEQALDVSAADQASVFMAMTSDHNRSELGIHDHNNEPSSSKLVPKVVPLAVKTATSRQD
ncbi:hypothetical protein Tco_1154221 [Tanacetum coccineum]